MKIVIIGAQAAGMSAAAKARRVNPNAEITVFEMSEVVSFGACGLPYFVGGDFDNPSFMAERSAEQFRQSGIDLRTRHQIEKIDAENKVVTVRNLATDEQFSHAYDRLMVATGASPIIPAIENLDLERVFCLKTMEDGLQLREITRLDAVQDITVIGAGYIGLEVAEALIKQGKKVRIIERAARVLTESFDEEITTEIETELRAKGVELHLDEQVLALTGITQVTGLRSDRGQYTTDMVIICAGVRPNTGFLANTAIERLGNGALIIDEQGRTSIKDIYAAGDCATVWHRVKQAPVYIPLATTANKIGRMLGENLSGAEKTFPGTLGSACVKVLGIEAGRTGLTEKDAIAAGFNVKAVVINDKNHTNYYPGQTDIRVKLIYEAETKKILGGQLVGAKDAVLRVNVLATAIHCGMTVNDLAMLDLCYAPPFARTWDALNVAGNVAK